jgi:hypothetical protein
MDAPCVDLRWLDAEAVRQRDDGVERRAKRRHRDLRQSAANRWRLDLRGVLGTSPTVNVSIAAAANTPPSATATFTPSPDDAMVSRYTLDIFRRGEDPNTATPTASANLGKPPMRRR